MCFAIFEYMKKSLFFYSILTLFLLSSCNNANNITYSYTLELEANSTYLVSNETIGIDYNFIINQSDIISNDYHNLNTIVSEGNVFLRPVAKEYIVENDETRFNKNLTYEETMEKLKPVIEFSNQELGNALFDNDLYNIPQGRTIKVTSLESNVKESQLYNIQITINDDIAPTFKNEEYSFESEVGYDSFWDFSYSTQEAKQEIKDFIIDKVSDNNPKTEITLHYSMNSSFNDVLTFDEMIKNVRSDPNLIKNHAIQPIDVYVKAEDSNNNLSQVMQLSLLLRDNVAPFLCDENYNEIKYPQLGFNETRQYYPDIYDDLKETFLSFNYKAYDEVEGEIELIDENYSLHINSNGTVLNIFPKNGTSGSVGDTNSKMIGNQHTSFIYYPEGSSSTKFPERGIVYRFINTNEISLIQPNIEDVSEWKGTDGNGNVILPSSITLYGHTYQVTRVASLFDYYLN